MDDDFSRIAALGAEQKARLVATKTTCPFVGSVVAQGRLTVLNTEADPLASIAEVRALGNSGGGSLGYLLALFASTRQVRMQGETGALDRRAPPGMFSLELPGSLGAHYGDSGILIGDPRVPGSGRWSEADFARLAMHAEGGLLKRSAVAAFIAQNLSREPRAKVLGKNVRVLLAHDLLAFLAAIGKAIARTLLGSAEAARAARADVPARFTALAMESDLMGASGEFALLFSLLANRPGAVRVDGEPALKLDDVEGMYRHKRLPDGWESWPKSLLVALANLAVLAFRARAEYARLQRARRQAA